MFFHGSTIAIVVLSVLLAGLLAFLGVRLVYRKDTEKENRRRSAIEVAAMLKGMGLSRLPKVLICYAVGDYSGLANEIKHFAELSIDPTAMAKEFEKVFTNVLAVKVGTAEGKAYVASVLANAGKPAVASTVVV